MVAERLDFEEHLRYEISWIEVRGGEGTYDVADECTGDSKLSIDGERNAGDEIWQLCPNMHSSFGNLVPMSSVLFSRGEMERGRTFQSLSLQSREPERKKRSSRGWKEMEVTKSRCYHPPISTHPLQTRRGTHLKCTETLCPRDLPKSDRLIHRAREQEIILPPFISPLSLNCR